MKSRAPIHVSVNIEMAKTFLTIEDKESEISNLRFQTAGTLGFGSLVSLVKCCVPFTQMRGARGCVCRVLLSISVAAWPSLPNVSAQQRQRPRVTASSQSTSSSLAGSSVKNRTVIVRTEPNAHVWLDEVRRGTTDQTGRLVIPNVSASRHTSRVRASGFREKSVPLLPRGSGSPIEVPLVRTTDKAELAFQQAEEIREKARDDEARKEAVAAYKRALKLRPVFPAAHIGLARVLLDMNEHDAALEQVREARRDRPAHPEASTVEGRILRDTADTDGAIGSFRRAIREARGIQPEAYTGLALVLEDKGQHEEAVRAFNQAIAQLFDTEPILYQLLGAVYEKLEKYKEAVAAYEKYLQLAPDGKLAPAISSMIDQLRIQAAEQESSSPN